MENYKGYTFKPYIKHGDYREFKIVEFEAKTYKKYIGTTGMAYVKVSGVFNDFYGDETQPGLMHFFEDGSWLIDFEFSSFEFWSRDFLKTQSK